MLHNRIFAVGEGARVFSLLKHARVIRSQSDRMISPQPLTTKASNGYPQSQGRNCTHLGTSFRVRTPDSLLSRWPGGQHRGDGRARGQGLHGSCGLRTRWAGVDEREARALHTTRHARALTHTYSHSCTHAHTHIHALTKTQTHPHTAHTHGAHTAHTNGARMAHHDRSTSRRLSVGSERDSLALQMRVQCQSSSARGWGGGGLGAQGVNERG